MAISSDPVSSFNAAKRSGESNWTREVVSGSEIGVKECSPFRFLFTFGADGPIFIIEKPGPDWQLLRRTNPRLPTLKGHSFGCPFDLQHCYQTGALVVSLSEAVFSVSWRFTPCISPPYPRYEPREVGGGRATRQPGQVRKEAAPTSQARVAVPASRLSPLSVSISYRRIDSRPRGRD